MQSRRLILFVKAPRAGAVKTRLAQALGAEKACAVYRRLAETLLREIAPLDEVELRFTPDDARPEIEPWARKGWVMTPQGTGDLGCRLAAAFAAAFRGGARRVVILGSDSPEVRLGDIETAWMMLLSQDVVLGPAMDGGYWLIGLRAPHPRLFEGVPWSTGAVLRETLARCRQARLRVALLRQVADIDTAADWRLAELLLRVAAAPDPAHVG